MIKSMTGYGKSNLSINSREYQVEIKTVNHKYIDVNIRMPRTISYLEEDIRKLVTSKLKRGKVDIYINFENYSEEGNEVIINSEIAKTYIRNLKKIAEEENISQNIEITEIAKLPDVLTVKNTLEEGLIKLELLQPVREALDNLIQMREKEGRKIAETINIKISTIKSKVEYIAALSTHLIDEYIEKLEARTKELLQTNEVDKARLMQEVVIYADKCSIEEEITRMQSHITQLKELLL